MINNDKHGREQFFEKMESTIPKRSNLCAMQFAPITNAAALFKIHQEIDDLDGAFSALSFRQQRKFNAMRARAKGQSF